MSSAPVPPSSRQAASDLRTHGVAVLPVLDDPSRRWWEGELWKAMDDFPEFRVRGRNVQRVLGGFGALGNPSSFHHRTIRQFRRKLKRLAVAPVMKEWALLRFGSARGVHLEAMFDRLCVRCEAFQRPTAEAWHRDIYDASTFRLRPLPHSLPGGEEDVIVGGWTNMDHREQRFVGLVGSHEGERGRGEEGGFTTFSDADIQRFRFGERLSGQAGLRFGNTIECDEKGEIRVPPGHCLLFAQRLVHSVKSGPQPTTPALRVFHGFRLTGERVPLFDHEGVLSNGAVPRIPSGQIPVMYSKNHYAAFSNPKDDRWRTWAEQTFHPACLHSRTTPSGIPYSTPGSRHNRNPAANTGRYMPSLAEMGMLEERGEEEEAGEAQVSPSFRYSAEEREALYPQPLE